MMLDGIMWSLCRLFNSSLYFVIVFFQDDEITQKLRRTKSDAREMQKFYQDFYEKYVKSLESSAGDNMYA